MARAIPIAPLSPATVNRMISFQLSPSPNFLRYLMKTVMDKNLERTVNR